MLLLYDGKGMAFNIRFVIGMLDMVDSAKDRVLHPSAFKEAVDVDQGRKDLF